MARRLNLLVVPLLAVLAAAWPARPAPAGAGAPNVLLIVTDDQRTQGTMKVMDETRTRFKEHGRRFTRASATTPLCCPSRSTIFTGRYAHNTGVRKNSDAGNLDQTTTMQRHLQDAGYTTAIVGKYLNQWDLENEDPPYFDRWAIFRQGYCTSDPCTFNVDGTVEEITQYSTRFIAQHAVDLIEDFESQDAAPWFLEVAPFAPHDPATPERKYRDADVGNWKGNPAVFESDKRDKPGYVRNAGTTFDEASRFRKHQLRTLLSVDDLVASVFATLARTGEKGDTLAIFMSDNGIYWGEHGLSGKNTPYSQSVSVPLFLRWPGHVPGGSTNRELVGNVDIAPTILDAAGAPLPTLPPMDGRSLLDEPSRNRILTEAWPRPAIPTTWAATRTTTYAYTEYYDLDGQTITFREYYDLKKDPWELVNLFHDHDPTNNPDEDPLHDQLATDRTCGGTIGPTSCP